MHYLIIDTCVWIDLCGKHTKLLDKIADLVYRGQLVLILPQVVLHEWEAKKDSIIENREASIRGQIKNARAIAQHLGQKEADYYRGVLDGFQQRKMIEGLIRKEIEAIDDLLKHPSTIMLESTDKVKLQAVDLALAKKAPFRDRNSMADALIALSALDYVTEQDLDNCIFVSSNTTDFGSQSDKTQIHPDLQPLFDDCGMKYCSNIGLAINQIEAGLVSDESIEAVEQDIWIAAMHDAFVVGQRRIVDSLGSVLDMPAIGEVFLESQTRMMESIRSMLEVPSVGQAFLESQQQMMENIKSVLELQTVNDAILESQRSALESIKSMLETPAISAAFLESQIRMMESIRSMLEAPTIGDALLESQRQMLARIRSAVGFSDVTDNTQANSPSLARLHQEVNGDEVVEGQADASSEQE
jgi:hypothetical protein